MVTRQRKADGRRSPVLQAMREQGSGGCTVPAKTVSRNRGQHALLTLVMITMAPAVGAQSGGGCFLADNPHTTAVLNKVIYTLSTDKGGDVRTSMKLQRLPKDSIRVVEDHAKCDSARVAIDKLRGEPTRPNRLFLIRIGNAYWAEDPDLRSGEWRQVYILSSDLRQVRDRY